MIFNNITFTNIGPYRNENTFAFTSDRHHNTVLIGGKNGAGKTTFLTGVRLALYGSLTYGSKTDTKEYFRRIRSILNNQALYLNENDFSIKINFETVENFKRVQCSISRIWKMKDERLKEEVFVQKNGKFLSENAKDIFFNTLRADFPPSLLELCLFDGEEIAKIINNDRISDYLNELSFKIFNLDLFDHLETDLRSYISQTISSNEIRKLESEQSTLKGALEEKELAVSSAIVEIGNQEEALEDVESVIEKLRNEFKIHGGLAQEERRQINEKISSIESERKQTNDQMKEFIAKDLPFYLARPIMINAVTQLNAEEDYHISNSLKEKILKLDMDEILNDSTKQEANEVKNRLLNKLVNVQDINLIHNASNTESQQVKAFVSLLSEERLVSFKDNSAFYKTALLKAQELRQQLKLNEQANEFEDMLQSIENASKEKHLIENSLHDKQEQLTELETELHFLQSQYAKISHRLYDLRKAEASFGQSEKIMTISRKFKELQIRNKMKDVEYFSTKMFKDLMRKKGFIKQVRIDSKSFHIEVIDTDNNLIDKNILSAGEKELLILSIIWGVFTTSRRELPFIFDTLLGRLDQEHKEAIVTKLIPAFGKQVIVLSTDSEIDTSLHQKMQTFIANEYTLDFDPYEKQTDIQQGFFGSFTEGIANK